MNGFRPCPFCGREDFEVDDEKFFNDLQAGSEDGKCCIRILCRCGAIFYDYTYDEHDYHKRIEILKNKWNRRSDCKECIVRKLDDLDTIAGQIEEG